MFMVAMKGMPGCGKSTISRALSKHLTWPVIDKDDVKDLFEDQMPGAGGLAYDIMFNIARRQLLQGLHVICDSPLSSLRGYQHAQEIAAETHASLVLIECCCCDEALWRDRINARQSLALPAHHQTDWEAFRASVYLTSAQASYPVSHPHLMVDTVRPLDECLVEIIGWLNDLAAANLTPPQTV